MKGGYYDNTYTYPNSYIDSGNGDRSYSSSYRSDHTANPRYSCWDWSSDVTI